MKKTKITVVACAMALVLVGTSFARISQIPSAEVSFGHDDEMITGSVQHDQDVKRRDGKITVDSAEGKGATVTIKLSLAGISEVANDHSDLDDPDMPMAVDMQN